MIISLLFFKEVQTMDIICQDKEILHIVKTIGLEKDISKIKLEFAKLRQKPYESVGCLIGELRVLNETKILYEDYEKYKDSIHVIWCLRALRYLTGLDFRAPTKYTLKDGARKYFLSLKEKTNLPFFATTMAHETIYIAPKDTQAEIIRKWREWYLKEGTTFNYKPIEDFDFWFY